MNRFKKTFPLSLSLTPFSLPLSLSIFNALVTHRATTRPQQRQQRQPIAKGPLGEVNVVSDPQDRIDSLKNDHFLIG